MPEIINDNTRGIRNKGTNSSDLLNELRQLINDGNALLIEHGQSKTYLISNHYSKYGNLEKLGRITGVYPYNGSSSTTLRVQRIKPEWRKRLDNTDLRILTLPAELKNWISWISPPWANDSACNYVICDPAKRNIKPLLQFPSINRPIISISSQGIEAIPLGDIGKPGLSLWRPVGSDKFAYRHEEVVPIKKIYLSRGIHIEISIKSQFTISKSSSTTMYGANELQLTASKIDGWSLKIAKSIYYNKGRLLDLLGSTKSYFLLDNINYEVKVAELGTKFSTNELSSELSILKLSGIYELQKHDKKALSLPGVDISGRINVELNIKASFFKEILKQAGKISKEAKVGQEVAEKIVEKAYKDLDISLEQKKLSKIVSNIDKRTRAIKGLIEKVEKKAGQKIARIAATRAGLFVVRAIPVINFIAIAYDIVTISILIGRYLVTRTKSRYSKVGETVAFQKKFPKLAVKLSVISINFKSGEKWRVDLHTFSYDTYYPSYPIAGFTMLNGRLVYVDIKNGKEVIWDYQGWLLENHPGEGEQAYALPHRT